MNPSSSDRSTLSLTDLPTETLENVLFHLPITTVCGEVGRTCRRLYSVTKNQQFWSSYLKKCKGYEPISSRTVDVDPLKRAVAFGKEEKRWTTDDCLNRWRSAQSHGCTVDALQIHETKNGARYAISGARDRSLILWDLSKVVNENNPSGWHKMFPAAHTGWIWSVCAAYDDKSVFSCGFDSMIKQWEIAEGGVLKKMNETHVGAVPMKVVSEGNTLYASTYDGRILMYDTRQGLTSPMTIELLPQRHRQVINSLTTRPDSDYLFALGSENGRLYSIDKRRMQVVRRRAKLNNCLFLQLDSDLLATSGKEGVVYYVNPLTLSTEYKWQLPDQTKDVKVNPILVSPGAFIYARSYQMRIYTPGRKPQMLAHLDSKEMIISVDYKNGDLACGFSEGIVRFWPRENRSFPLVDPNE